jgi:hypothetical protein
MATLMQLTHIVNIIHSQESGKTNYGDDNMKKMSIGILFVSFLFFNGYAKKIGVLPEIMEPVMIAMNNNRLFISQQYSVFVYSLPNCKLVKRFGSKGEGPGQFMTRLFVHSSADKIFVCDPFKIISYSYNGNLIEERKFYNQFLRSIPLGENLVVLTMELHEKKLRNNVLMLDKNLKTINNLHYGKPYTLIPDKKICLIEPMTSFWCNRENVILLDGNKGFHIEIFDQTGKKIRTIKRKLKKQPITELHKQRHLELRMAISLAFIKNWKRNRNRFYFPQFLPEVQDVFPTDKYIYVKTYLLKGKKEEYLILDMKGNPKGTIYLPNARKGLYSFTGDGFYYIKENHESEEWELFMEKLSLIWTEEEDR